MPTEGKSQGEGSTLALIGIFISYSFIMGVGLGTGYLCHLLLAKPADWHEPSADEKKPGTWEVTSGKAALEAEAKKEG